MMVKLAPVGTRMNRAFAEIVILYRPIWPLTQANLPRAFKKVR